VVNVQGQTAKEKVDLSIGTALGVGRTQSKEKFILPKGMGV
jgi:hypothetical protein